MSRVTASSSAIGVPLDTIAGVTADNVQDGIAAIKTQVDTKVNLNGGNVLNNVQIINTSAGTPTAVDITGLSVIPNFQIIGITANTQMAAIQYSADTIPPVFNLLKSRGALNTQSLLLSGDELGRLQFRGSDGVNFQAGASVRAAVDGVAAVGSMPGRLSFLTTPLGSTNPLERMRIDNAGYTTLTNGAFLTNIPLAPFNLINSAAGTLRTQLNIVNTGGGGGAGSAIDFHTYDVSGGTLPGARIAALDNNFSADIAFTTKTPGASTNAIVERMRITSTGQVSINQATPAASAILQVDSTTQGLLPPRMTTAQRLAITSPATGIVVYDITDNSMYCFDGNFWTCMSGIYKANNNTTLTNNSNTTLTNVTDMAINVVNGKTYIIDAYILFRSAATNTGIALSIGATGAAGQMNCVAEIPVAGDGTGSNLQGQITALGDVVVGTGVQATNTTYLARIEGIFQCTTSGTIFPQFRSENGGTNVSFLPVSRWNLREV